MVVRCARCPAGCTDVCLLNRPSNVRTRDGCGQSMLVGACMVHFPVPCRHICTKWYILASHSSPPCNCPLSWRASNFGSEACRVCEEGVERPVLWCQPLHNGNCCVYATGAIVCLVGWITLSYRSACGGSTCHLYKMHECWRVS